uniref:Uncharacterized protein n=1 Tax=Tetraselmis chuii TaxID=63592 RepID=A0A7S1SS13_9CHLO|eukprot:CAMPEP_0177767754 /NCGR_PEP_ID=MMETSP0491_2-20121128/9315_1 /TAXON_ID=63592 /ORGANISM="Tetraselmis chuii, Strain PLY429" /LENGTH=133 /DNA_ID=CAMNT_0019284433 /DNA_START=158 /DNA_END=559 /DNA_ORIENTATION=+
MLALRRLTIKIATAPKVHQSRSLASKHQERPRYTDKELWVQESESEGLVEVGVCSGVEPKGLHFIDVAPVGTILAPGRVWGMLEGEDDERKALQAPCCGEIAEINENAVREADINSWLIRAYCDRVLPSMKPE